MSLISGKALWGIICGQSVLASEDVVGQELEIAVEHLKEGMSFYEPYTDDEHKTWSEKTKCKKEQKDFVLKLSKMMDLSSNHSWLLFQLFLKNEYKGSVQHLSTILNSERGETILLQDFFTFYLSDPLHLLSCRRHILAADVNHPYQPLFKNFVSKDLDANSELGPKLISQLKSLNKHENKPGKLSSSAHLLPNCVQSWISHRLAAIKHQLATILVYHATPSRPIPLQSLIELFKLAQGGGLGREFMEFVDKAGQSAFSSQLTAIDAFHCHLLVLGINTDGEISSHPLCTSNNSSRLSSIIKTLGSRQWHLPSILAWAILQKRRIDFLKSKEDSILFGRLAQRAIKGNVFSYMNNVLKLPAFQSDHLLLNLGESVMYDLLCASASCLEIDKIGLEYQAQSLAQTCLAHDPPSALFWGGQGGGANFLLPPCLEVFPHNPQPILKLLTTLASSNQLSCNKVIELFRELESFTWFYPDSITQEEHQPLPGVIIPSNTPGSVVNSSLGMPSKESSFKENFGSTSVTPNMFQMSYPMGLLMPMSATPVNQFRSFSSPKPSGTIICWELPTNGWQVLLGAFKALNMQMENGIVYNEWLMSIVPSGLDLMSAIIETDARHLNSLQHLFSEARHIMKSVSQSTKPNYILLKSLFNFFCHASKASKFELWKDIEGGTILPSLHIASAASSGSNLLHGYKSGSLRSLVLGEEVRTGDYNILKSLCCLCQDAVNAHIDNPIIRGCILFVLKEVVPMLYQWKFVSMLEKAVVVETTFSLLHHSLEEGSIPKAFRQFLISDLLNEGGACLKKVLYSGQYLEASLDHPLEWPHSSHLTKLTRGTQLALSLTHRLIGHYLSTNSNLKNLPLLEGNSPNVNLVRTTMGTQSNPHLALTVAQFVHHRHNPRLPYLALKTLTRMAKDPGLPLVACLGSEGEGLRDCLLNRLDSPTEDLWVKVALIRLFTCSTECQPGLIRLFLTPPNMLLETIVNLTQIHKTNKSEASLELLSSVLELVSSLWSLNFTTALAYLREQEMLWETLSHCMETREPNIINEALIGHILVIYSMEYYLVKSLEMNCSVSKAVKRFCDDNNDIFSMWFVYIFVSSIKSSMPQNSPEKRRKIDHPFLLLRSARDFIIVLMSKNGVLTKSQKIFLSEQSIEGLLYCLDSTDASPSMFLNLLAEIQLMLVNNYASIVVSSISYRKYLARLVGSLRASTMQVEALTQAKILAIVIKVLSCAESEIVKKEISTSIVMSSILLTEQHCSLVQNTQSKNELGFLPSSPAVLSLSCSLLHLCLLQHQQGSENLLQDSNLVHALMKAAHDHIKISPNSCVKDILVLLSLLARNSFGSPHNVCTEEISFSIGLAITEQECDYSILSELLWCMTWCQKRQGADGLKGTVNIMSIELDTIFNILQNPHTCPDLALSAIALISTTMPYHQLWRVENKMVFDILTKAIATCVHRTGKLLHMKETLEREIIGCSKEKCDSTKQINELINKLLQILNSSLYSLLPLTPSLMSILCTPCPDLPSLEEVLFDPTCRRLTSNDPSLIPNLASLADILDLHHVILPKDVRSHSPMKTSCSEGAINTTLIAQCEDLALMLLCSCSAYFLIGSDVLPRDQRDIKTFLQDETSSFFGYWLGKRGSIVPPSPLLTSVPSMLISPGSTTLCNLPFLKLCSQVVNSLCKLK